ncbi:hypothetical protein DXT76_13595 [Halobacillus trueperi]|uniref:Uncharacterized protein n=1 Tax=Halobacillus trueperi TaxID=156205 RepID=A0A3D8VLX1_9BACI|nr:hypothetical protein [Halobacillus trueperi]RDY70302.1 hypothetical protein DXT76_13595 [Halobacillus trueperi]
MPTYNLKDKCQYSGCKLAPTYYAVGYQGVENTDAIYQMCEEHAFEIDECPALITGTRGHDILELAKRETAISQVNNSQVVNLPVRHAVWLIQQADKKSKYEEFIRACQFAGRDGLTTLRKEANQLLRDHTKAMNLNDILRKEQE